MKSKIIKSSFILIVGTIITKILGMIIKILLVKYLGPHGLGLYMLVLPTFLLLSTLSQFSFPLSISYLMLSNNYNTKKIYVSIIPLILFINIILIILIIMIAPFISNTLLKQTDTYPSIIAMGISIPFISISSICRSYFFGQERMFPIILSNILEEISKLLIIVMLKDLFLTIESKYSVCILILSTIFTEIISTITLLFFLPNKINIEKKDLIPSISYMKKTLKICIPNTSISLISSLSYFLEPIILINILTRLKYPNSYIETEYGIITGIILNIVSIPLLFISQINNAVLPSLTKLNNNMDKARTKKLIKYTIFINTIISLPIYIIIFINPKLLLSIIYNKTIGYRYLKILTIPYFLATITSIIQTYFISCGMNNINLKISIINCFIKVICLIILSLLNIGIYSYILAIFVCNIISSIYEFKLIKKYL